jgi:SAM-dependent methyltransferase
MDGDARAIYGDSWATFYDSVYSAPGRDQIQFLISRAQGGPVLELAVGSGRVALPIVAAGVAVDGVEISPRMIDQLRAKPLGSEVKVVATDMTDFTVSHPYPLIYLGFNTLFAPLTEPLQRSVFECVAAALAPGGRFVVECFVPDLGRFDRGQTVRAVEVSTDRVIVEYSMHDAVHQRTSSIIEIRWADGRSVMLPVEVRYMFPDQVDAMATGAGFTLVERYEWYDETPFTDASPRHISVYGRA